MKLGDIKIEALRLMFVQNAEVLNIDNIDTYALDENYGFFISKMNGSINRCFADLEVKGIIPTAVETLSAVGGSVFGKRMSFNVSGVKMTELMRVVHEDEKSGERYELYDEHEYISEEKRLILPAIGEGECYKLYYKPKMPRIVNVVKKTEGDAENGDEIISSDVYISQNGQEIPLPEHIAAIIPLYIKGELYVEDEPSEAAEARNQYEAAAEQIRDSERSCAAVRTVYAFDMI